MALPKARLSQKQRALLQLLRQRAGNTISEADILKVTGWKTSAWRVYRNNGLHAPYLREHSAKNYLVTFRPDASDEEFWRQVTQSKRVERFDRPLARALLQRSADNFSLALEVYNRPTLANRVDAFALLFTTAWEQLLKTELVEAHDEDIIFKPVKPNHRRESISLQACLERLVPDDKDPVRRNVEMLAELRHEAAHLVMKELQAVYSRLFQAGVFNYARRYRERAGTTVVPRHNVGMLALAAEPDQLDAAPLAKLYGDAVANDIIAQAQTVGDLVRDIDNEGVAIPIEWTLRFAKDGEAPDVTLVKATEAPTSAVVFGSPPIPRNSSAATDSARSTGSGKAWRWRQVQ
jgi:hypothetical protein